LVAVATVTHSMTIGFTVPPVIFTCTALPVVLFQVNGLVHTVIATALAVLFTNSVSESIVLHIIQEFVQGVELIAQGVFDIYISTGSSDIPV
jgi:hypothetical protein